jgi:hypothetical protein
MAINNLFIYMQSITISFISFLITRLPVKILLMHQRITLFSIIQYISTILSYFIIPFCLILVTEALNI